MGRRSEGDVEGCLCVGDDADLADGYEALLVAGADVHDAGEDGLVGVRRHAAEIVDMAEELFHEGRAEIAGDEQDENALLEILSKRNKHKPDEPAKTEEYRR